MNLVVGINVEIIINKKIDYLKKIKNHVDLYFKKIRFKEKYFKLTFYFNNMLFNMNVDKLSKIIKFIKNLPRN